METFQKLFEFYWSFINFVRMYPKVETKYLLKRAIMKNQQNKNYSELFWVRLKFSKRFMMFYYVTTWLLLTFKWKCKYWMGCNHTDMKVNCIEGFNLKTAYILP